MFYMTVLLRWRKGLWFTGRTASWKTIILFCQARQVKECDFFIIIYNLFMPSKNEIGMSLN